MKKLAEQKKSNVDPLLSEPEQEETSRIVTRK